MSEEKFTFDDSTLAGKVGLHLLDRAERAEAEVARLEALFQATHNVHHSWVAEVTRLRAALQAIHDEYDSGPAFRLSRDALVTTSAKNEGP